MLFSLNVKRTKTCAMNIHDLNKAKLPIVTIDSALEKYKEKVLFKEKLDKANEVLRSVGLPKKKHSRQSSSQP
jgi:hypothetical protein